MSHCTLYGVHLLLIQRVARGIGIPLLAIGLLEAIGFDRFQSLSTTLRGLARALFMAAYKLGKSIPANCRRALSVLTSAVAVVGFLVIALAAVAVVVGLCFIMLLDDPIGFMLMFGSSFDTWNRLVEFAIGCFILGGTHIQGWHALLSYGMQPTNAASMDPRPADAPVGPHLRQPLWAVLNSSFERLFLISSLVVAVVEAIVVVATIVLFPTATMMLLWSVSAVLTGAASALVWILSKVMLALSRREGIKWVKAGLILLTLVLLLASLS